MKSTIRDRTVERDRFLQVPDFIAGTRLGSILGCFFRRLVFPFFKNNGKQMLTNAVETGLEVADDVLEGQSLKAFAKKAFRQV